MLDAARETRRKQSRDEEDKDCVPVIIKRTDEKRRHPYHALDDAIQEGLEQLNRPVFALLLSAIAAGLIPGFSAMAVAVVLTACGQLQSPEMVSRIATSFVYPPGFFACILSGAQLFTEHTATAFYPVLDGKARPSTLIRLGLVVIVGNLIGADACAGLQAWATGVVNAREGYPEIGRHLVDFSVSSLLVSSILAG
jgi:formate/nitrite transporter FocA (FNT family)